MDNIHSVDCTLYPSKSVIRRDIKIIRVLVYSSIKQSQKYKNQIKYKHVVVLLGFGSECELDDLSKI